MKASTILLIVLLMKSFSDAEDESSEIRIQPESADAVRAGTDILLTCVYTAEDIENVVWIAPNGEEIFDSPERKIEPDVGHLFLTLVAISSGDEGQYSCQGFSRSANNTISVTKEVAVFEPVEIINTPLLQEFELNRTISVICNVKGRPEPNIHWLQGTDKIEMENNEKFSMPVGSSNLVINNISKADEGAYTCRARELSKGQTKDAEIEVKVLIPPQIFDFNKAVTTVEGNDETFSCLATGEPEPNYRWYRGDGKIRDNSTLVVEGSMLKLSGITRDMNDELYTCIAENKIAAHSATFQLTVYVKPTFTVSESFTTEEKQQAVLRCVAEGDPMPVVTFFRDGFALDNFVAVAVGPEDNSTLDENTTETNGQWSLNREVIYQGNEATLNFTYTTFSDAGVYECRATSDAGIESVNVMLTVQYGPREKQLTSVYSCNGDLATLECQFNSNPAPNLDWGLSDTAGEGSNDSDPDKMSFVAFNTSNPPEGISIVEIGDVLQLNVDTSIVTDPWKTYYCKAENKIDFIIAPAEIRQAQKPEPPLDVEVTNVGTREATVMFTPPILPLVKIDMFEIRLIPTSNEEDIVKETIDGSLNDYTFTELEHNTEYTVVVEATNCADTSLPSDLFKFRTKAIEIPPPVDIVSGKASEDHDKYTVAWRVNGEGGGEISKISIVVKKVEQEIDNTTTLGEALEEVMIEPGDQEFDEGRYTIEDLDPASQYEVFVNIYNEVGSANSSVMFITATKPVTTTQPDGNKDKLAAGSVDGFVIVIVVVVFLLLLVIIDVTCFFTRSWGVTMWVYSHTCGKSQKHKVDAEEGSAEFRQEQEGKYSVTEQS